MKLAINIESDNAAFWDSSCPKDPDYVAYQTSLLLEDIIRQITRCGKRAGPCIDINGNKVGEWSFEV